MRSALCTVLERSAVHKTSNTPNSCVDCSTNTLASRLRGNEHSVDHKYLHGEVKCGDSSRENSSLTWSYEPVYLFFRFRMYINFFDMDAGNVAHNSDTFG